MVILRKGYRHPEWIGLARRAYPAGRDPGNYLNWVQAGSEYIPPHRLNWADFDIRPVAGTLNRRNCFVRTALRPRHPGCLRT